MNCTLTQICIIAALSGLFSAFLMVPILVFNHMHSEAISKTDTTRKEDVYRMTAKQIAEQTYNLNLRMVLQSRGLDSCVGCHY